jgi:proteic killer suppression protein
MIRSFRHRDTERLYFDQDVARWRFIERIVRRKLLQIDAAERLTDLAAPPGNRLEALRGKRVGQYSIRINDQWRICFEWRNGDAYNVEVVDYH